MMEDHSQIIYFGIDEEEERYQLWLEQQEFEIYNSDDYEYQFPEEDDSEDNSEDDSDIQFKDQLKQQFEDQIGIYSEYCLNFIYNLLN